MFQPRFSLSPGIVKALLQIEACREAIGGLPVDAALLQHLRESAALAATHYSTQIEGNRLTLPEVRAALRGERHPGRERDEMEVRNHFRALEAMEKMANAPGPVAGKDIQRLHGLVLTGRNRASPWRTVQNVIREAVSGRIVYLPPEAQDVPGLMQDLFDWVNLGIETGEYPAPVVAALAHYQFATVHPWLDGNGRTARLLATLILRKTGYGLKGIYSLDEHYARNLAAYYDALTVGRHNYYDGRAQADVTHFIAYFCDGMAAAFAKIKAAASQTGATQIRDRPISLRDLDPRQRRLLVLFRNQGSATSAEMAAHLKLSPRTVVALCRQWTASGFLQCRNAARKNRSYCLGGNNQGLAT